jgi:tetratricopeptide (TPR) repeat protein
MNTTFLAQLKSHLPEQSWPWVIAALRQDELVWETLQASCTFLQFSTEDNQLPESWNPARVAFLTLQQTVPPPNAALSLGLRQRAFRTYESITQHHQITTVEAQPMVRAALLAVALRERLRLTGKWDHLTEELSLAPYEIWRTPLACLYGLIEKPLELLRSLLSSGASPEIYNLAIHSLLSNPLPPEVQSNQLLVLIENLPISDRNMILSQLTNIRPSLAADLARQENNYTQPETSNTPLDALVNHIHRAEIALIAGNSTQAAESFNAAQEKARRVQANLAAQSAQVGNTPMASLQRAFELAPEEPVYRFRLALAYMESHNTTEANAILEPAIIKDRSDLLYASAQLAHLTGDDDRACQLASQALEIIETSSPDYLNHGNNNFSLPLQLAQFFLLLDLPSAGIRAARIAIRERPDDSERLILLGQAQSAAGQYNQAAEAYQWAVLLKPQQFDLHRELAKNLEAAGDWALALEERKIMAAAPSSPVDDRYALADCALHNNQAAYAADLCRVILTKDPKDGLAHTLLGEALAAVGDLPAAQVHFTQASELAPSLARPWLALSRAQTKCNEPQKALETLRIASQAIPLSAEIHQALGENYLAANAPTQALEAFQRAADIDPQNIPIALRLGQTLYQLGHLPQAYEVLKQAYHQVPSNIEVALTYARILMGQDDPQSALPALETVIHSNPIDPAPYIDYARALLLTRGEATKATEALRHALELLPDHAEALALLGESLAAENNYNASLQAYQTALETPLAQNPEWRARLSFGLGGVALHLGQVETAIAASLEAVHIDPQNYRPHCQLAEAYQTAGLTPDAYQSASEALRLAGDDIHVMIWYVEKTLELAGKRQTSVNGTVQQHPRHEEIQIHALQVLTRAAEIAPAQADLFLRIANIQCEAGDFTSAASNLRKIATIKSATTAELQQAAQLLLTLNDAVGAVSCFEKALDNEQETSEIKERRISLLSQLANAHRQASNPQAALLTIEKAIILSPEDSRLCSDKALLLLELSQPKSAINFLEETISRLPDPRLHHTASIIMQKEGKLLDALEHAEAGANSQLTPGKSEYETAQLDCVVLAAELSRALLLPDRTRQILGDHIVNIKSQNNAIYSNYHAICAETALENGEEIEAANYLSIALKDIDTHSARLLSLQARLTARRGDYPTALTTFQSALQNLGDIELGNLGSSKLQEERLSLLSSKPHTTLIPSPSTLYPLTDAAIELNLWGIALRLAQKAVQLAPSEPLAHLSLAQVLVLRAEYQYLCNDSDLVNHAPGPVSLSEGTSRTFDQAIQETLSICEGNSQRTHAPAVPLALARWQIRGNAVFTPSQETAQALSVWAGQNSCPGDVAASLAILRRMSISNDQQMVYSNQQAGVILTQIAISLANKNPEEAVKALQIAILNEPVRNTSNAIRHYLLARLTHMLHVPAASPAIQTAITLLPDEPRWCALAAKIALAGGDKAAAINFLEQAIQLEPRHVDHHLNLGQLYLHYAEDSNVTEALQAVKFLEHACRLAPEHPEAWLLLARAHRITGNLDQAAAAAEQSTTLAPDIAASHLVQAEIALQFGKPQAAHDHAQTALHLQPDSHQAAMVLSRSLQALERPAEALAVIDKAIPASEHTTSLSIERIQLLRQSQGPEIALKSANELAQMNPDEPIVLAILADVQADAGQEETAIRTAQKAILLGEGLSTPQQANLRLLLGKLLRRAGQLDQAVYHLEEVIRMVPEKIEAFLELGRTHQDRRQQAQALLMYRRAANIAPHDPRPYLQAGLALKEGKDYLESESMLRRAADLAPNDPTIRRQLAAVIAINLVHNPRRSLQTESV